MIIPPCTSYIHQLYWNRLLREHVPDYWEGTFKQQDIAAKRMRCPQYLISFHVWVIDLFFGLIIFSVHQVSLFKVPD